MPRRTGGFFVEKTIFENTMSQHCLRSGHGSGDVFD